MHAQYLHAQWTAAADIAHNRQCMPSAVRPPAAAAPCMQAARHSWPPAAQPSMVNSDCIPTCIVRQTTAAWPSSLCPCSTQGLGPRKCWAGSGLHSTLPLHLTTYLARMYSAPRLLILRHLLTPGRAVQCSARRTTVQTKTTACSSPQAAQEETPCIADIHFCLCVYSPCRRAPPPLPLAAMFSRNALPLGREIDPRLAFKNPRLQSTC